VREIYGNSLYITAQKKQLARLASVAHWLDKAGAELAQYRIHVPNIRVEHIEEADRLVERVQDCLTEVHSCISQNATNLFEAEELQVKLMNMQELT